MENKLDYIINKVSKIKNLKILELGVREGKSTKKFLKLCENNNGHLTSIDIDDYSNILSSKNWKFIHSSDDDFQKIDKLISPNIDLLFIDSLHEPEHIKKVFFHYYQYLKVGGFCFIDDVSWLPYVKGEYRDSQYVENMNRSIFKMILEIYISNQSNIDLEFYLKDSGYGFITKKNDSYLNQPKKIVNREFSLKNIVKKFYKRKPKR